MLAGALPASAMAAEWAIEPAIDSSATWTDNVNFTPGGHDSVWGWMVAPHATFARRTEATEVAGTARLGFNRYPGNTNLDATNASLVLNSNFVQERSRYGLGLSFIRDSTLESELATTGVAQPRQQRNLLSLTPNWSYTLDERSSVFAQYQYDDAHYQTGGLEDYRNHQVTAGYQYAISERLAATLSGSYARYETDIGSVKTESYYANTGLVYSATERLKLNLAIGARRSYSTITISGDVCPADPAFPLLCVLFNIPFQHFTESEKTRDSGLTFNGGADYQWETATAGIVLTRDLNPTGSGLMVKTDRFGIQGTRNFSDRLSASASGSYLVSRYLGGVGNETTYYRTDFTLSYKLDPWWSTSLSYSYAHQTVKGVTQDTAANTVSLTIGYNWPKISVSR